jgi:hypothetical protein
MLLGGCGASLQARKVDPSVSPLVNPSIFEKGTGDQALYRYAKPGVDFKQYTKVMIDPVTIWRNADTAAIAPADARTLIDDLEVVLRITLDDD